MITPAYALTATERVLPRLALDFTTAALDPRVTFTRSGNTATVTNSSGVIVGVNADIPRFDYDPVTRVCKGLLIEESRVNLLTYSSEFNDASWLKTRSSLSANVVVSPDGSSNADKLIEDTTAANTHYTQKTGLLLTGVYTFSVYAKADTRSQIQLAAIGGTTPMGRGFSLDTGTIFGESLGGVSSNDLGQTITPVGNGWYRCTMSWTATGQTSAWVVLSNAGAATYTGDGTSGLYIWGAQLEAGAFATSYIPTVASQVTRSADVATMTGTNFSNWYNATQGTFAAKGTRFATGLVTNILGVSDGTSSNRLRFYQETNNRMSFNSSVLGTTTTGNGASTYGVAGAYSSNGIAVACNGGSVASSVAGAVPTGITSMDIGRNSPAAAVTLNGWLQSIQYWPQRLTNAELQAFSK